MGICVKRLEAVTRSLVSVLKSRLIKSARPHTSHLYSPSFVHFMALKQGHLTSFIVLVISVTATRELCHLNVFAETSDGLTQQPEDAWQ